MGELPRITRALRAHTNLEKPRNLTQSIKMQRAAKFKYKPRYKTFSEIVDHIKKNETQYDSIIKLLENLKDECHNMTGEESYEIAEEASVHMLLLFLDQQLVLVDHIATLRALYGAVTSSTANTILKIVQKITALISDDTKEYIKDETDVVIEDREVKELIDCWGGLMICGDKSYGPEADERKMREMKQKRGTDSKIVEEFSMSYKEPKPVKDVSKDNACASSSKPQFGKDWLEDNIRKHYPANTAAILQGVLNYLHSPKNNEEIQNELFDLIGFENLHLVEDLLIHRKEIVKDLLAPKPSANRMAGTGARPKIPKPEKDKKMPQFLCQVSVQTEQDKLLAKLTRKEEKKMSKNMSKNKRDKEDIEETPELTLEQLAHERLLLYVKPPYECPNYDYRDPILRRIKYHEGYIQYPHVYDSSRKAKNAAGYISMSRVILPENTIRKENKEYEEVTLPKSEPAPLEVGDTLIAVSELDEVGQMAFENIKELNRIQSVVFQTAYNTNENLLICAPTGAGKTNIALLTVVHQIKKHTEHNVILKDKFKIIYIAPMKALAAEMTASFGKRLRGLGISVRELTGDMKLTRAEVQDTQMIVTTPEKWDVVTRKGFTETELTTIVKLIIIDEVHLLNGDRGPVVEAIVARTLRQVESSQNMIRIIGLSATLPNYLDVARFLRVNPNIGLFFFDSRFRPVPLEQHFIGVKEIPKNSTVLGQLQQMNDICYDKALEMVKQGHQVMVFVHARNATHNLASIFKTLAQLKGHTKHFESEASAGFLKAQKSINSSPNKVLAELFSAGFACHHAGMLRSDRNLVEKYFSDGYIKVLVCTSTLAWGVNLPAHAVIIRGTEVYDDSKGSYVDLSILDVLQIFGRAGRPQFDTSGTAYIVTTQDKLNHYLRAMTCQMPIESNFITLLADNLNAEVALGTVATIDEAAEWLSYTFLFERMKLRPIAYGLRNQDVLYEPNLETKRRELCIAAAKRLDKATMIRYTESLGDLHTTDLGRTASHYYITVETMETFNKRVRKSMTPADVMAMLTLCSDFKQLKSRREEARELDALRDEHCHLGVGAARFSDEPNVKVNILLQSHISRAKVYSASLQTDLNYIAQNAVRVIRALFEITLRKNNSYMAAMYLNMAKMFELQMWEFHSVMRQFNCFSQEVINKIEQPLLEPHHLRDMDVHELGDLIRNPKVARQLSKCAYEFPLLEMEATMHPITMTILKIRLTITADFNWNDKYHGKSPEAFWVWVEDPEYDIMYYQEYFLLTKKQVISREPQELVIMIPLVEPLPPQYYIRATSERWLGSESVLPLTFHHLILPDMHPQNVELRHLRPIPKTALGKLSYESLYNFTHFNPIQTQIFNTVYHTDNNVLLGAPTGSGKTIVAELAMFRAFNKNPKCKVVYIAPLKALVKERVKDWKIRFENKLGLRVVELTGDVSPDMRAILNSQVIVTTPEKWDGISRSWQSRPYVRDVTLMVIDEIHLLGEDRGPVLEVIVSRANFITTHTRRKLRIVGLTTALANASDLGRWLKIGERGVYNFKPTVRPVPMQIHVLGFPGRHYCPRMLTMNKPTFQAIKTYSPKAPSLVFVSSRRQTRLTALDLIAFLASEVDPKQWLHMAESEMEQILSSVKDSNLKLTLAFGIGIHHAGLHERDRQTVEELFVNQKIQVLICTATLAWGVNFPAHLVVIKGTEYFDGKQKRYVDMPITDVMQMVGRAGRPQYDNEGVAVLLVHDSKKNFYMKFLYEPFPVESNLREVLSDHLNAEIVADTLLSKEDIVEYMSSTYLFIRLMKNPSYYNLESNEPEEVNSYLEKLIDTALAQLIDASCVEYGSDQLRLDATFVGRIASYYYLSHKTMAHFRARLTDRLGAEELLRVLADCEEYATLPVRHNEDVLNGELADHMRLPVDRLALDSSNVKAFLLLQAHILRAPLPNVDYSTDTKSVLDQTIRILQAMIDMSAEYGWLSVCLACQTLMQSIVQARWPTDSPLTILPHVESQHLKIFTEINKEIKRPVGVLNGLKKYCSYEILAKHMRKDKQFDEKQIEQIYTAIREFPTLNLKFAVRRQLNGEPKTKEIRLRRRGNPWTELIIDQEYELIVTMERQGGNTTNVYCPRFPRSKNEGWFLNLGIKDIGELVALKRVPPKGKSSLTFRTPSQPGRVIYTVYVMSDTYMGLDQQYNLQFEVIDPMPTLALENLSISADKE